MSQKYVGLDLGTHEVKAVLVSAGLRATQVLEVAVESVPLRSGDDGVSASLEQGLTLLRRRGWNHYRVGVVLPGSAASFRVLKFPFHDPRRIAQTIPFEAEGQFPIPLEDLEYDHIPLATGQTGQALMVAVRRETIDRVTRAFKAASIDLKLITVDVIATAQVLDSAIPELVKTEPTDNRVAAVLLLDIGNHTTDLVAYGPKGPIAARVLRPRRRPRDARAAGALPPRRWRRRAGQARQRVPAAPRAPASCRRRSSSRARWWRGRSSRSSARSSTRGCGCAPSSASRSRRSASAAAARTCAGSTRISASRSACRRCAPARATTSSGAASAVTTGPAPARRSAPPSAAPGAR
jgi:hypothetical protein